MLSSTYGRRGGEVEKKAVTLLLLEQADVERGREIGLGFGCPNPIHSAVVRPDKIPSKAPWKQKVEGNIL